jgi:hypothetical protein
MVGTVSSATSNKQLTSYYESLRSNVISILGHVKVPNEMESSMSGATSKENFDSYLTKLQTICTDNMNNEEVKPIHYHHSHHHGGTSGVGTTSDPMKFSSQAAAAAAVMPSSI